MAGSSKPTIVLVTGAWHKPNMYSSLISDLETAGYPVIAPALPSVGGTCDSFDEDVALVHDLVAGEVNQGRAVVVLMHSYGGMVGGAAVKGLGSHEISNGGGVTRLIYLTAFAMDEGISLWNALNNQPLPWFGDANPKQWSANNATEICYNDVDPQIAAELETRLELQAKGVFLSKQTYAAWKYIDSTYVVCDKDNAIPKAAQEGMASQPGGKFTVEHLDASHSPWLSMPKETLDVVRKAIEGSA